MRFMPSFIISSDFFDVFHLFSCLNRKDAKDAKGFLMPFPDRNPGETITKEGFTGQADDQEKYNEKSGMFVHNVKRA